MIEELKARAADHWREWLPEKWAELVKTDALDQALSTAARQAEKEIRGWMEKGARLDEAEEIVLPQYILLKPENPDSLGEELDEELRQRAEEYQANIGVTYLNPEDMEIIRL